MALQSTTPVTVNNPIGLQNISADPLYVKFGPGTASDTVWDFILAGATGENDGTGGGFDLRGLGLSRLSFYSPGTISYSLF